MRFLIIMFLFNDVLKKEPRLSESFLSVLVCSKYRTRFFGLYKKFVIFIQSIESKLCKTVKVAGKLLESSEIILKHPPLTSILMPSMRAFVKGCLLTPQNWEGAGICKKFLKNSGVFLMRLKDLMPERRLNLANLQNINKL